MAGAKAALRLDEAVAERTGVTRSRARALIMAGRVLVDGRQMTKPGANVRSEARVDVENAPQYVSRGGEKLAAALDAFGVDPLGKRTLDVGASTGGFTDCLLGRGAAHVVALDVGYGQLAYPLRIDPRVTVMERVNFRLLPDDAFKVAFDVVTIDASFISVCMLVRRALGFLADGGDIVALIKPQFEAGRERLGRGGVVRDPLVHRAVLHETVEAISALGAAAVALVRSPLRGPAGNVEFFALIRKHGAGVDAAAIDTVLA